MVQTGSDSKWITSVSHLRVLALMRCLPQNCHRFLGANDSYRAGRSQTGMSTKGLIQPVAGVVQLGLNRAHI